MSDAKTINRKISTVYNTIRREKTAPRDVLRLFVATIDHANTYGDSTLFARLIKDAPDAKYSKRLLRMANALGITLAENDGKVTINGLGVKVTMPADYTKLQELAKTDATLFGKESQAVIADPEKEAKAKPEAKETTETGDEPTPEVVANLDVWNATDVFNAFAALHVDDQGPLLTMMQQAHDAAIAAELDIFAPREAAV